jgi:osmotically-inducible protein OsmY
MKYAAFLLVAVATVLASGCTHTVQGVQQDAQDNAPVVQAAAQQAGQAISQVDKVASVDVSKAGVKLNKVDHEADIALLSPEIKAEIIADKDFDNTHNLINVESSTKGVYLSGHVINPSLKAKANQIASSVISKRGITVGLHNQLAISPG